MVGLGDKTGDNSYKYLKLQDKIVTTKEMDEFRKKFADEKPNPMLIIRRT